MGAPRDGETGGMWDHLPLENLLPLTDDEVKRRLRTAVAAKIICGWYRHMPVRGREWVINPGNGAPTVSYTAQEVRDYCALLDQMTP